MVFLMCLFTFFQNHVALLREQEMLGQRKKTTPQARPAPKDSNPQSDRSVPIAPDRTPPVPNEPFKPSGSHYNENNEEWMESDAEELLNDPSLTAGVLQLEVDEL